MGRKKRNSPKDVVLHVWKHWITSQLDWNFFLEFGGQEQLCHVNVKKILYGTFNDLKFLNYEVSVISLWFRRYEALIRLILISESYAVPYEPPNYFKESIMKCKNCLEFPSYMFSREGLGGWVHIVQTKSSKLFPIHLDLIGRTTSFCVCL